MFGIGGSEILVILVIALLFLGPDKLPEAAKTISKHVRELKKQGRILTQTIENDEHIGGAIRDLKSALRGDEIVARPPPKKLPQPTIAKPDDIAKVEAVEAKEQAAEAKEQVAEAKEQVAEAKEQVAEAKEQATEAHEPAAEVGADAPKSTVTLPPTAGEVDPDARTTDPEGEELAKLVKPAAGAVARESAAERKHG